MSSNDKQKTVKMPDPIDIKLEPPKFSSSASTIVQPEELVERLNDFKNARRSMMNKCGTQFSPNKLLKNLKRGKYANKVRKSASIYTAAILEYLTYEVLKVAGDVTKNEKKKKITPRHLKVGISGCMELKQLFEGVVFATGGFVPK